MELVTVIVILGILAAVVLPRLGGVSVYGERASGDRLVSGLSYAQQQALSRNRFVRVELGQLSLSQFRIHYCQGDADTPGDCGSWSPLSPPSTTGQAWGLAGGLRFDSQPTLYFDALGRSVEKSGGAVTGATDITLGDGAVTVTVEGETGYAHRP